MTEMAPVLALQLYYHGGIGLVRSLGRLGVPVHAIQADMTAPATRSRYLREVFEWDFAAASNADSLAFVLAAGRRLGPGVVLVATDDRGQQFVADNVEELRRVFTFPRQTTGLTEQLGSKQGLHELCLEHGLSSPQADFPQNADEAHRLIERAAFPLMFKPIDKVRFQQRNSIAMHLAQDRADALEAYDRLEDPEAPNIMFQEYIPGPSSAIWVYTGYFDAESQLLFGAGGTKLRQYPIHTGTTCFGDVRSNPPMEAETARFVKAIGYSGVFDCGFRYDTRDGRYKLLDVNPRVGANFRQCVGSDGMDVVRAMYLDLCGQPVPPETSAEGRVWWVENIDIAAAADLWREKTLSPRRWLSSVRRVDEAAWFARDDMAPFRAMCRKTARVAARRLSPWGG